MKQKTLFTGMVILLLSITGPMIFSQQVLQQKKNRQLTLQKQPLTLAVPYKFEIQGIKRILTTPELVKFQVQYFISPHYPKPCFISAYIPNKAGMSSKFGFRPAGRLPNGVPKGQKHFTDNVVFEAIFHDPRPYRSQTIEVVIYDADKNLKTTIINWGQLWGRTAPQQTAADLVIQSIQVSKYNPYQKTTFTFRIRNNGGTAVGQTDISIWFWKLNPNGSLPATPNEFWPGKVPGNPAGTIGPGQEVVFTKDKYEFLVDGNFRVKAKINPFNNVAESNTGNNEKILNFTIPN